MDTEVEHEGDYTPVDAEDSLTEEPIQWHMPFCRAPDRKHVNKLLNYSEDNSSTELSDQLYSQSGWEDAVQGWNTCIPMISLIQLQKKCRKTKTGDSQYHCLLCTDLKYSQNPGPDQSVGSETSDANGSSAEEHEDKGSPLAMSPNTDKQSLKDQEEVTNQPEVGDKIHDAFQKMLPSLSIISLSRQSPPEKYNEAIRKFVILPPMKGSNYPWNRGEVTRRSLGACSPSTPDSLTAENGSYGIPATAELCVEGNETTPVTHMDPKVPEDSYRHLTPKFRQSSRNLLSAFSISIPRRFSASTDDTVHLVGRKAKCDNQRRVSIKYCHSHKMKRTEPNIPTLLGTRVPILSASHRLLYPPNV